MLFLGGGGVKHVNIGMNLAEIKTQKLHLNKISGGGEGAGMAGSPSLSLYLFIKLKPILVGVGLKRIE